MSGVDGIPALAPAPTSFHVLLPPGWRGYGVDLAARGELEAQVKSSFKGSGRPDLEAELRSMVRRYWAGLQRARAVAVYMPGPGAAEVPLPASIIASRFAASASTSLESTARATANVDVETFDLPHGRVLRWVRSRSEPGDGVVRSMLIHHLFPVPGENPRNGMLLTTAIPHLADGGTDAAIEPLTLLSDAIAETFRWT